VTLGLLPEAVAGVPIVSVVVIGLIVLVGSFVQGAIGLGLGMFGAPLIALLEPELVPTLLLLLAVVISSGVMVAEWSHVSWRAIGWALPARIPGTVLGVWLATSFSHQALGILIAVVVLVAIALTVRTVEVDQTPANLFTAGFAAGTAGTAAAIGGPPMAIVMAHRPPREVRGTLSVFFVVGSMMSLALFAVEGELPHATLVLSGLYLPLVVIAFVAATLTHRRIPRDTFRRAVLALCGLSAAVLLVRSALG
jgi:uncharacterized membrane protein YfcA